MPNLPSFCHARLPKAGLGNKLFIWAKAYVFSRLNNLPLVVTGWTQLQLGSFIRGGDLRLYWNYFKKVDQVGRVIRREADRLSERVHEPPVTRTNIAPHNVIYEFSDVPSWKDYFADLRAHRDDIRSALMDMLTPARQTEVSRFVAPPVCVQIRLGDYRALVPGEDFAKTGNVRTPTEYFERIIHGIREIHGSVVPVEVVSDGKPFQMRELLSLPEVKMAPRRSTIAEMMVMSRSRILVTSAGSTFGYWAGFLGEPALIIHPDHVHKPIRPDSANCNSYEGSLTGPPAFWPPSFSGLVRRI